MFWEIFWCYWRWTGGWFKQSTSPLYSHRNLFVTLLIHAPSFSWDSSLQSCLWVICRKWWRHFTKCPKLWLKSGNGSLTVSLSGVTELLGDSTFSSTSFVSFFFTLGFKFWNFFLEYEEPDFFLLVFFLLSLLPHAKSQPIRCYNVTHWLTFLQLIFVPLEVLLSNLLRHFS